MEGVGHSDEVAALQRDYERLVAAWLVDMVEETQALQDIQRARAVAHPVGVPSHRRFARRPDDAGHAVGDEAALGLGVELIAVLPGAAMRGRLVAATHDLARKLGCAVDGAADHEGAHLDLMLVEQVEQARDALIHAILEESVGRQVGEAMSDRIGYHTACPVYGLASAFA